MTAITKTAFLSASALLMENEYLKVIVLPASGGKIASLLHKESGFELAAQNTCGGYFTPERTTLFEACDASGFDDAFPTIGASTLVHDGHEWHYTDHGEIWRSAFSYTIEGERLILCYESRENPYTYTKTISLNGHEMICQYHIKNTGDRDWPCLWASHALVRYEEDMELVYPKGAKRVLNVSESPELGDIGALFSIDDSAYNFRGVPARNPKTAVKYYLSGKTEEGRCGYRYPSQGMQCLIAYDCNALPYLGFWVTAGGYRGDYNCAFEPANGFYDVIDIANANDALFILKSGENFDFSMRFELTRMEKEG